VPKKINWDELYRIYRERNRQDGPEYTLKQLAEDTGQAYSTLVQKARADQWHDRMVSDRRAFQERVAEEVAERARIDQVKARTLMLTPGEVAAKILLDELRLLLKRREALKADRGVMKIGDLRSLAKIAKELIETGAGLPREHKVAVDQVHDEIRLGREQQRELERAGLGLADWKKARRAKAKSSKKKPRKGGPKGGGRGTKA
jgi:hypothetical protein